MNEQMQRSRAFIIQVPHIIIKPTKAKHAKTHERKWLEANQKKSQKHLHMPKLDE